MAKYVCNCPAVTKIGDELLSVSEELKASISEYGTKIESDLAQWNGQAKANFLNSINGVYVPVTKDLIQAIGDLGSFVKKFSDDVAEVEYEYSANEI